MAGGNWLAQNKVRPGAYLNFKTVSRPMMTLGDRGIATIGLPLSWGPVDVLIDVYSDELLDGPSLPKIGFTAFDEESKLLGRILSYAYLVKVYRMDTGGVKATATAGNLTCTAKYPGTLGNKIIITISSVGSLFEVDTYVKGTLRDSQRVSNISELENNDYVTFTGTGALAVTASKPLSGGTNGTVSETTVYPNYLALLKTAKWQCMAVTTKTASIKASITTFIENEWTNKGRYVQACMANYAEADHEGIISVLNSCYIDGVQFTPEEFTAVFAGMTAGAAINQSNTGQVVRGATDIIGELDDPEVITALRAGHIVLTPNQDGEIKIEQDINTYHNFTPEKNRAFSKNRIVRIIMEYGTTIKSTWERFFMGKVDNDDEGRALFKASIVNFSLTLQGLRALTNFTADDITVSRGEEVDAVIAEAWIQPVDAMEKLYMNISLTV